MGAEWVQTCTAWQPRAYMIEPSYCGLYGKARDWQIEQWPLSSPKRTYWHPMVSSHSLVHSCSDATIRLSWLPAKETSGVGMSSQGCSGEPDGASGG